MVATLAKNINPSARSMFDGTLASATKYPFQQQSESILNVVYSTCCSKWKIRAVEDYRD